MLQAERKMLVTSAVLVIVVMIQYGPLIMNPVLMKVPL